MNDSGPNVDIAIVGAGPVGMALGRALANSRWRTLLIDSRPRGSWIADARALAVAYGSRQLLERLDAWDGTSATAIREIHVSQQGGFGRTRIEADDYHLPALGYVVRYRDLAGALDLALNNNCSGLDWIAPGTLETVDVRNDALHLQLRHRNEPLSVSARLVVHAEGTTHDGEGIWQHEYRQHAIIADVRPTEPHRHRAWERFTPQGPLALLPHGEDYSVVLTSPSKNAEDLLRLDDAAFLDALRKRLGRRLDFVSAGPRVAFPLALRLRKQLTQPRQVWIGNSAQTLHPVTGQGFNLGLRDAWELAEALNDRSCTDPGDPGTLARYARRRQADRFIGAGLTDGCVRVFSNDFAPLRTARGMALAALDLAPPLRHLIAGQMIWGTRPPGR